MRGGLTRRPVGPRQFIPPVRSSLPPGAINRPESVRRHFAAWLNDHGQSYDNLLLYRGDYSQLPGIADFLRSETGAGIAADRLTLALNYSRPAACAAQAYEQLALKLPREAALIDECRQRVRNVYLTLAGQPADKLRPEWEVRLLALTDLALRLGAEDPPRRLSEWAQSDSALLDADIQNFLNALPQDSVVGPKQLSQAINLLRGRDINDPGDLGSRNEDILAVADYERFTSAANRPTATYRRCAAALRTYAQASAAADGPLLQEIPRDAASIEAAAQRFDGIPGLVLALQSLHSTQRGLASSTSATAPVRQSARASASRPPPLPLVPGRATRLPDPLTEFKARSRRAATTEPATQRGHAAALDDFQHWLRREYNLDLSAALRDGFPHGFYIDQYKATAGVKGKATIQVAMRNFLNFMGDESLAAPAGER